MGGSRGAGEDEGEEGGCELDKEEKWDSVWMRAASRRSWARAAASLIVRVMKEGMPWMEKRGHRNEEGASWGFRGSRGAV